MDAREVRIAKNEALFRSINERVEEIAESFDLFEDKDTLTEFFCECGKAECLERIELTRAEYESVRADPSHFAVVPGHESHDVERIVRPGDRFDVVAKHPEEARVAQESDPRA